MSHVSARQFQFTSYHWTKDLVIDDEYHVVYAKWQKEECPTTKRLHLQGYVECSQTVRISRIQKWLGDETAHIEKAKKPEALINYSSKDYTRVDGPWEIGTRKVSKQGKRNDIAQFRDDILNGATDEDLILNSPMLVARYPKFIGAVRSNTKRRFVRKIEVEDIICNEDEVPDIVADITTKHPNSYIYCETMKNWFEGYQNEANLIILQPKGWLTEKVYKSLTDGIRRPLPCKGAVTYGVWEKVFIIANEPRDLWFVSEVSPVILDGANIDYEILKQIINKPKQRIEQQD